MDPKTADRCKNIKLSEKDKQTAEQMASQIRRYQNNGQMTKKIEQLATAQKRKGKLDNAKLDQFRDRLMPELNTEQRKKLNEIIDKLKRL